MRNNIVKSAISSLCGVITLSSAAGLLAWADEINLPQSGINVFMMVCGIGVLMLVTFIFLMATIKYFMDDN